MTTEQLIIILKQYPSFMRVIIEGCEDGYNDVSDIEVKQVVANVNTQRYYGQHIDAKDILRMEEISSPNIEGALLISGKNLMAD
ncbi:MAG: hypothetical protein JXB34_06780 [Bacteroidales bacterium]|nr:hypothetical protein [Bacteroidales bacterium]